MNELTILLETIYELTGFKCYEPTQSSNAQLTFYGISANLPNFKTLVAGKLETGTIVYCMDTAESTMYYKGTDTWY